jgi:hypothetical protein
LRRSFAEALRSSLPKIEEPFGPSNSTIARVLRWLAIPARAGPMSTYTDKEIDIQARTKSSEKGRRVQTFSTEKSSLTKIDVSNTKTMVKASPAKDNPLKTAPVPLPTLSGKESASRLWGRVAGSSSPMLPSVSRKVHFGDSLDLHSIRQTLEKLHVEIGYCLKGLHLLEDDLLGRGPKLHGPSPLFKTQPKSLGSKLPRPKSSKPLFGPRSLRVNPSVKR